MTIITVSRAATTDEISAEMDRRGAVIERLETNVRHWREECGKLHAQNAELVAALTEIDTCTPPFGCESVYEWMAVRCKRVARAALVAHPASSAGNDGGTDYEAKARETTDWILGFMEDECSLLPECVDWADRRNIANAIFNALAQAAAGHKRESGK